MQKNHLKQIVYVLSVASLTYPVTSLANESDSSDSNVERITVHGAMLRDEGALEITKEDLEQTMATTADEIFRNVANLEAIQGPGRQFYDLNLRGSEGAGSVVVSVDGAEKNLVTTKHGTSFNPVFLVPEFLKVVTVIRGPVSNSFGTGSTGGRIQFETIDPFDYVESVERIGGELRLNAENNGDGRLASGVFAASISDDAAVLGAVSRRKYDDYEDGNGQEVLNSGSESTNYLTKLQWDLSADLSVEATHAQSNIDYIGSNVFGRNNNRQDADFSNDVSDKSTSLQIDYSGQDGFEWMSDLFFSSTDHVETLIANRRGSNSAIGTQEIREVDTYGIQTVISQQTRLLHFPATLSFGFSGSFNDLDFGGADEDIGGSRDNYGVFAQASIEITEKWQLIPGLRYERFDLQTDDDLASDGNEWTPKLTLNYHVVDGVTLFSTLARGIRAPSLNDLVIGSTEERVRGNNTTITTQLPSDNLEHEIADTIDLGIRINHSWGNRQSIRGSFTYFDNNISNRIESVVLSREVQGNTTFIESQIQNVGEASIYGIELNAEYRFGGFLIGVTYADTEGKREDTGEELNSVRPESGTLYIGWSGLDDRLVLQAEVESFGGKTELGDGGVIGDSTESATLGNLFVGYAITDNLVLKGRINNVTDEFYRRFDQIDNGIGRNFRVEALYRF